MGGYCCSLFQYGKSLNIAAAASSSSSDLISCTLIREGYSSLPKTDSYSSESCESSYSDIKTNAYVELYKPIYVALYSDQINEQLSYAVDDEFEFIRYIDDDYLLLLHLRTNIECRINKNYVKLDDETPLRLGIDDRGVTQRCLLQYNRHGAYLIRRSQNEKDGFVLSISNAKYQRNSQDWHYLILKHKTTHEFYLAHEIKLKHLLFTSLKKLTLNEEVRTIIRLKTMMPYFIEFEEGLWDIPRRQIVFRTIIGKGEFGEVWQGAWKNGERLIPIAIKRLHAFKYDTHLSHSFAQEIEVMKKMRNNYIVTLYGISQDPETNETLIVTEFMENGDLKKWLKSQKNVPNENTVISYATDISSGMLYLEQKSLVHRDLACRNLLLCRNGTKVKIADFGLSAIIKKDDFVQLNVAYLQKIPIRWVAPEILKNRTHYSTKSDVWSFGIVLIEIWLKGCDPYPEFKTFDQISRCVRHGYVHKKPSSCSSNFYNTFIFPCLSFEPSKRPKFNTLLKNIKRWKEGYLMYGQLHQASNQF